MKVLIACEFSGIVRDAFIRAGHDAMSCDIEPSESDFGPHYQGSVIDLLGQPFDLMIAHPPCTYLSYAGLRHWNNPGRAELRQEAVAFAMALYNSPIPRVCVENPKGYLTEGFQPASQYINPFQFGEPVRKHTGLWLKNLPLLKPTLVLPAPAAVRTQTKGVMHRGRLKDRHHIDSLTSKKERSRFFVGIAEAMAAQWGSLPILPQVYTQTSLFHAS